MLHTTKSLKSSMSQLESQMKKQKEMGEKLNLKWNDFPSNVTKSFVQLRNEDDFYDVTLVCDDQNQVSAHKLVLSSCSEFFQTVLKLNKHVHPLLCLDGITSEEMKNVLDYIYFGEAEVYKNDLDRFMCIAQRLKLRGLLSQEGNQGGTNQDERNFQGEEGQGEKSQQMTNYEPEESQESKEDLAPEECNYQEEESQEDEKMIESSSSMIKQEIPESSDIILRMKEPPAVQQDIVEEYSGDNMTNMNDSFQQQDYAENFNYYGDSTFATTANNRYVQVVCHDKFNTVEELDEKILEYIERHAGRSWKCNVCDKICNRKITAVEHAEIHFSNLSFPCHFCDKTLKSRAAHRQHVRNRHKDSEGVLIPDTITKDCLYNKMLHSRQQDSMQMMTNFS